jgi:hypothetical protein
MKNAAVFAPGVRAWAVGVCIAAALLVSVPSADASPILVDFSASTCFGCWSSPTLPSVNVSGQLTLESIVGTYWDPVYQSYETGERLKVLGITGSLTIDGSAPYSLSFVGANPAANGWSAPLGDGSWLFNDSFPRYLVFSTAGFGFDTRIINDNAYNLFQWSSPTTGFGSQVPVRWTATPVPEESSLALLGLGVAALIFFKCKCIAP